MARLALFGIGLLFGAVLLTSIDSPALATASPRDLKECGDVDNAAMAEHNIEVCGRIIADSTETISNQALAYANRCGLLFTKREYDRALPDCDKAIELNPN